MDHPKCKTCKHFSIDADAWDMPANFGKCDLIPMTCDMAKWDEKRDNLVLEDEFKGFLAGVMDGSSYMAVLYPHPDFYCPMHSDIFTPQEGTQ